VKVSRPRLARSSVGGYAGVIRFGTGLSLGSAGNHAVRLLALVLTPRLLDALVELLRAALELLRLTFELIGYPGRPPPSGGQVETTCENSVRVATRNRNSITQIAGAAQRGHWASESAAIR
jgi:hypothetical protein